MFYVPLVRTLRAASEAVVWKKWLVRTVDEENPTLVEEVEVEEEVPMESVIKYLPIGNYKWCVYSCRVDDFPPKFNFSDSDILLYFVRSAIEIDTRNPERPKLNLEVVIDGKVAYKWVTSIIFLPHGVDCLFFSV